MEILHTSCVGIGDRLTLDKGREQGQEVILGILISNFNRGQVERTDFCERLRGAASVTGAGGRHRELAEHTNGILPFVDRQIEAAVDRHVCPLGHVRGSIPSDGLEAEHDVSVVTVFQSDTRCGHKIDPTYMGLEEDTSGGCPCT